jgi:cytidine deaminase
MLVDQPLVDAAMALATARYPSGWAAAAAMYTADGRVRTSVYAASPNDQAELCVETGASCEAHKLNVPIAASVCVSRETEKEPFIILTPCGICQERLAFWGGDVQVAVPQPDDPTKWLSELPREVQSYYWRKVVAAF